MGFPARPEGHPGMSVRTAAAISIMQALVASPNLSQSATLNDVARRAVNLADELLAELRK
jgi:hypothetical protein